MTIDSDIGRLNMLLELITECAETTDTASLLRVVAGRARWVLEFERCTVVLAAGSTMVAPIAAYWTVTRDRDHFERVAPDALPPAHRAMIDDVLRTGAPRASGAPVSGLCHPLDAPEQRLGALCLSDDRNGYSYRDSRFVHHIAKVLATTVARHEQIEIIQRQSVEVESANRAKDEFLAILGHELRNPLSPILLAVDLLARRTADAPLREVEVIRRQAEHVSRLVDDLLDVSRVTAGKLVLVRVPVDVAQVVARAVEMTGPLFEQQRHTLDVDVPAGGLWIDGDEARLTQVVANLLTNAARYTDPVGHVQVIARRDDHEVVIDVIDNGHGLAAAMLPRVFETFVQAAREPIARAGLGLGLSIVKSLTELHGGSVSARSEGVNRGTTFTVRLPGSRAPTAAREAPVATPATATRAYRILIVDDNKDVADLVSQLLVNAGHDVVVLHEGHAALSKLHELRPEVALLDLGLPAMNGYELAREIRARLGDDRPYLIAHTGFGQPDDRARSRAAGFDEHLVKPARLEELLAAIERRRTLLGSAHAATR